MIRVPMVIGPLLQLPNNEASIVIEVFLSMTAVGGAFRK